MTALPQSFIDQIHSQLGDEAEPFLHSYGEARTFGLRLNPLKLGSDPADAPATKAMQRLFGLAPVPWCPTGYYYDEAAKPGKHPYHQAGLFYIQEPSAMSSAELLDPQPGDIVLDLAAAPGGKTTQIAGKLRGQGLLVANEIHPVRAKICAENVERMGIANTVVTNASPDALAARLAGVFDKILLDAPCSGEGMFRKDPDAIGEWSPEHVHRCARRQLDILDAAAAMLKPGGTLAYSTCTFNRAENEDVLEAFAAGHPAFSVLRTERLWPHRVRGEGHFVALLRKDDGGGPDQGGPGSPGSRRAHGGGKRSGGGGDKATGEALRLAERMLREVAPGFALERGEPMLFGEQLYWLPTAAGGPQTAAAWDGVRTARPGLHIAHVKKGRAEPGHSLAMALRADMCRSVVSLRADDPDTEAFLKGETIAARDGAAGWTLVAVEGYPLGWGKASGGQLKNHYPKGLRKT